MTRFKCKCGEVVCEGSIKRDEKGKLKLFLDGLVEKFNGTLLKNKSNNPKKWTFICSKCQKKSC